nr:MAG TPA: hypothetical protein [Caudoviricetes sp.]
MNRAASRELPADSSGTNVSRSRCGHGRPTGCTGRPPRK